MFGAESSPTLSPSFNGDRRASLISEAAVERGRVNNALDKLRKVEEQRSQVELSASNEQRRMQQEFSLELQRRDAKIDELERLLQHAEKASSENEVQLASSSWEQGHLRDRLGQAGARDSEMQAKIRELLDQLQRLRDTLQSSQEATQAARDRIGFLESSAAAVKEVTCAAESAMKDEIFTLKAEAEATAEAHRNALGKLQGRLDLEMGLAAMTREEADKAKNELDRTANTLRFEQDMRSERERDVRDRDHRVAEGQVSNAMLHQRVGESNAQLEVQRAKVAEVEACLRLKEREAERAAAAATKDALHVQEALQVQLRAAKELADARRERSTHASAEAASTREALLECREQKARVEETLALALKAAAKEKADLDDRLAAAIHARRLTEASGHATTAQLSAAEERERELRGAVVLREDVNAELEHRLQVAAAINDEQKHARSLAERDADDVRLRLDHLVEASTVGLTQPLSQAILSLSPSQAPRSPAASNKQLTFAGSPGFTPRANPETPTPAATTKTVTPATPPPAQPILKYIGALLLAFALSTLFLRSSTGPRDSTPVPFGALEIPLLLLSLYLLILAK
mmetsp:Transcript_7616/g.14348  ORF Transcript_7616/g.14348 Transcript_7616/m.14348 type:complete len:580 (-) Transcript_7616:319-2058(-)|eukprot:CAMPEP_0171722010 /NCGR_PEP_ID=MMETSP0991-20121206/22739_1 /TAXON_ID=483369 /ORGANISM="non described non described, Strain CCMP2098" /LENGTH=579 /DNA_ID=CAMNT_0012314067 /DNA_START=55 /DNA_END=1794 /DNA_ORIENTATION=-